MASRVSQAMVEVLGQVAASASLARVSQAMVEVGTQMPASAALARVSQAMVEVLASTAPPVPGGTSGHWFRDSFDDESELYEDYN